MTPNAENPVAPFDPSTGDGAPIDFESYDFIHYSPKVEQLLASDRLQHPTGSLIFPAPAEMFRRMMAGLSDLVENEVPLYVDAEMADATQVIDRTDASVRHTAYQRVVLRITIPTEEDDRARRMLAVVYDLKSKNPMVQVASGAQVSACVNQSVWSDDQIASYAIVGGGLNRIEPFVRAYINRSDAEWTQFTRMRDWAHERRLTRREWTDVVGKLYVDAVDGTKATSIPQSSLSYSVASILDPKNERYFFDDNGHLSAWQFLQSITEHTSQKSTTNRIYPNTLVAHKAVFSYLR